MDFTIRDPLLSIQNTYKVSRGTFTLYLLSCFLFWIVALALLCNGCFRYKYGTLLFIFILIQPLFSFMNDYYDLYNNLKIWSCMDRIWACTTLLISLLFTYENKFYNHGWTYYVIFLSLGLICWSYGLYLHTTKSYHTDSWAWMTILWHIFPVLGATITIYHLKPQLTKIN